MKKRILLIIPLIMLMIVSCIPLTSSAVTLTEDNADVFDNPEEYPTESWPAIRDYYNNSEHYLFFFYKDGNNHCLYLSDIDYFYEFASVEETSSTITISFDFPSGHNNPHWYDRYNWTDGFRVNQLNFDTYDNSPLVYDKSNKTLTWGTRFTNLPILKFETDLIDSSDAGLEVSFLPIDFTGTVGESYQIGNTTAQLFQIDMEVVNNTGKNYEFLWAIVPHGNSLDFIPNNVDCQTKGFIGSPAWVYASNEWCITLNPDGFVSGSSSGSSSEGHSPTQNTYLPCAWHWSPSHSTNSFQACIKNMKLYTGKQYDCFVYAVPTLSDKLSIVDSLSVNSTQTIDFSAIECVYSSSFTMGFNTPFDKDYNAAGVLSYDPDSDSEDFFTHSTARYNPDTHELEIGYDMRNNVRTNNYFNTYSSSSDSYSLIDNTRSVFLFVSSTFSYFPSDVVRLFYFGFATLILVAILKAVR